MQWDLLHNAFLRITIKYDIEKEAVTHGINELWLSDISCIIRKKQ